MCFKNALKCPYAEGAEGEVMGSDIRGTCGGIVSDDCGTYIMKTLPEWGHECW